MNWLTSISTPNQRIAWTQVQLGIANIFVAEVTICCYFNSWGLINRYLSKEFLFPKVYYNIRLILVIDLTFYDEFRSQTLKQGNAPNLQPIVEWIWTPCYSVETEKLSISLVSNGILFVGKIFSSAAPSDNSNPTFEINPPVSQIMAIDFGCTTATVIASYTSLGTVSVQGMATFTDPSGNK